MKRQSISISLDTLKELEKQIKEEIKSIRKTTGLGIQHEDRISVMFPIINYSTITAKGNIYCSDTWQFEGLKLKRKK